ncbi:hypothetical protein ACFWP7_41290 [Streptomyces sp. NPDC058470]|uniref:hypothetical protein n=1 Tax=Streptomyces sp. NPDC058470 TaxID=3346515 RepID=UPI00365E3C65
MAVPSSAALAIVAVETNTVASPVKPGLATRSPLRATADVTVPGSGQLARHPGGKGLNQAVAAAGSTAAHALRTQRSSR